MPSAPPAEPPAEDAAPQVRTVTVAGTRAIPSARVAEAAARETVGKPGDAAAVRAAVRAVLSLYRARGYTMARVVGSEIAPDGALSLTVAEGVIRQVVVKGNGRTKSFVIRQALSLSPGDVYNEKRISADRARLARLGIFGDVSVSAQVPGAEEDDKAQGKGAPQPGAPQPAAPAPANPTTDPAAGGATQPPAAPATGTVETNPPPSAPPLVPASPLAPSEEMVGQVDVIVRVQERPTGNVAATVGYSDGTGAVGFVDLSEENLLGTGQRAALTWQRTAQSRFRPDGTIERSDSRSAFEFSYDVPAIRPNSLAFGLDFYDKNTVFLPFFNGGNQTLRTYERRRGGRGRVGGQLRGLPLAAFVTARRDDVGYDPVPAELNPPYRELANARGTVGAVGLQLVADGRDVADNPQRGYRHAVAYENAGSLLGGNRAFQQVTLDLRGYAPLARADGGSGGSRTTRKPVPVLATRILGGVLTGDVPLSEQYFLGGFDLLRGYDLFSVRGDRMVLATVEGRVPIGAGLQGVVFTEAGNAWNPGRRLGVRDLKGSAGVGLRFLSPIGPIRLDLAYGSRFQTYVSLGQSF